MSKINLSKMSEGELRSLNKEVCQLLETISLKKKESFNIGDRVSFKTKSGVAVGRVSKINPKTIGVDLDNGTKYRVSPGLLTKVTKLRSVLAEEEPMNKNNYFDFSQHARCDLDEEEE